METKPSILIFKGDATLCYGILRVYSSYLKDALISLGEDVVFFDPSSDDIRECFGKNYKAVIGFMETFFYNRLPDRDELLFDLIGGPKFNYLPDHPAYYWQFKDSFPKDYHILTEDRNYVKFINKYFGIDSFWLPPGGIGAGTEGIPFVDREMDVSFLGTYVDYREVLNSFNSSDETTRIITGTYMDYMLHNPNVTTEDAFAAVLKGLGASVTTEQFLDELYKIHRIATMGAARYYKEMAVKEIIDGGITLDVFGDSWRKAPFAGNRNLRIHSEVAAEEVYRIYQKSKISLNVMTWHKDAITERVLDSMLAGSIALSDKTPALCENFENEKDILYFSLDRLDRLPEIIRNNLNREDIALSGKRRALDTHTWKDRAAKLLDIIEKIR